MVPDNVEAALNAGGILVSSWMPMERAHPLPWGLSLNRVPTCVVISINTKQI